jgi:nucleotide-binding universal stress UspA family protein
MLRGSVARGIQKRAATTAGMAPSHVLVPMDGSPLSDDALEHALETFDCRVTVLNVVTSLDEGMSESGLIETDEDRLAAARERAERVVEDARERAEAAGQTVETAVETGEPAETVLEFVEDHDVDHVVMGGHGGERGRVARRLLGTTATAVVGEAPVSVTVVR